MAKRNSVGSMQRNGNAGKNFVAGYGTAQDQDEDVVDHAGPLYTQNM